MTEANMSVPEPVPNTEAGKMIYPLVLKDIEDRVKFGKLKYGTELHAHNGRNPLVDAYQEAIDLVMYLRQAIEEDESSQ